jgi:hypothetical protein
VVLEAQYNWNENYKERINKISGFCRTKENERYARGFRFVHQNGCIQLLWKTSATDTIWKGEGDSENGFIILRSFPLKPPSVVPPEPDAQATKKQLEQLNSSSLLSYLKTIKKTAELDWLKLAAETGSCPTNGGTKTVLKKGEN